MGRFTERFKVMQQQPDAQAQPQFVSPGVSPAQQREAISAVSPPIGRFTQRALAKPPEREVGFVEGIQESFTGAGRTTPETEKLPEVFGKGSPLTGKEEFRVSDIKPFLGMFISVDDEDREGIIKQMRPGVTFRSDEKGNRIGTYKGKDFVLNKPGFSQTDALSIIGELQLFGAASKIGQGMKGLLGLGTRVGAMTAAEFGRGETVEALGGEEQPLTETGEAAALEIAGEAFVPAIVKGGGAIGRAAARVTPEPVGRKIKELGESAVERMGKIVDEEAFKMLRRSQKLEKEVPLGILGPQASEVPSDLIAMRVLHEQPATSRQMATIDMMQDKAGKREFYKFLAKIAKSPSFEKGAKQFREAAEGITTRLKKERKDQTEALYGSIFADPVDVDINPVVSMIDSKLTGYPSEKSVVRKKLEDVRDLIIQEKQKIKLYDASGRLMESEAIGTADMKILHNARMQISDMIEKAGPEGVSGTTKKELVEIKESLTEAMQTADPRYEEVTNLYREMSKPIKDLEETIVGKGVKLKNADLERMSSIMFDPKKVKPNKLRALKAVIDEVDPEAFGSLLRAKIEGQLRSIPDTLSATRYGKKGRDYSVGEIYKAMSRSQAESDLIRSVLTKDQAKNFTYLKEQLRKASLGRSGGSDTVPKATLIEKLRGTVAGTLISVAAPAYAFGSVGAGLSGARMLSGKVKDRNLDRRLGYLYDAILDPKWEKDMARIRRLDPQTPAAGRAMAQLINNIESQDKED